MGRSGVMLRLGLRPSAIGVRGCAMWAAIIRSTNEGKVRTEQELRLEKIEGLRLRGGGRNCIERDYVTFFIHVDCRSGHFIWLDVFVFDDGERTAGQANDG